MSDIVYVKVSNGEDIIATVLDEDDECYFITCPFRFMYTRDPATNIIGAAMIPWVPLEELMESIFQIYKFNIITFSQAPEKMKTTYENRIKSSKIDVLKNIQDLYEAIEKNPDLNNLLNANTVNDLIH
jgi:hypothetical protein